LLYAMTQMGHPSEAVAVARREDNPGKADVAETALQAELAASTPSITALQALAKGHAP
jgi:hypothetical protein